MTGRSTPATLSWLHHDREAQRAIWFQRCLQRARTARGFPSVFPSALAAQHGTPMSDRVYHQENFERGMVVYLDNPSDSNPFGHIVTIVGRNRAGQIIVDTNDAIISGRGSLVTLGWFPLNWNVPVVFAAKSLNGFGLDLGKPGVVRQPVRRDKPELENLHYAEHRLDKAITYWKHERGGRHHPALVKALVHDREAIQNTIKRFGQAG